MQIFLLFLESWWWKIRQLTVKQKRFADEYIIGGNATQAYIDAGYSAKKRTVAEANARRLLGNDSVKAYIDKKMKELDEKAIASQEEILRYLTSLLRGEETEIELIGTGNGYQKEIEVPVKHQQCLRAAELLGRRYAMWTDRVEQTSKNTEITLGDDDFGDD